MTTTYAPTAANPAPGGATRRTPSLRRTTVLVGVAAAAATTALAAIAGAAGVPLTVPGGEIPLAGFAQVTFVGAVLGGILLAVLNRRSTEPHRRFLQITVMLTALSCIPSIASPPDVATKVALVLTHLVAAAIIVPVLARHADH